MIAVIADDLSGATELASVARAAGLGSEVQTVFEKDCGAEVVAVDTDTRAGSVEAARERMRLAATQILASRPAWIYKKTDSVLRGHVRTEISELMAAAGKTGALFVPANPGRERIIRKGRYFVSGVPLDKTIFAQDPAFPAFTAEVEALLQREPGREIQVLRGAPVPKSFQGILAPDVANARDLAALAKEADPGVICAGAAEFFEALLRARWGGERRMEAPEEPSPSGPVLFVCGSAAGWPERQVESGRRGISAWVMPEELWREPAANREVALDAWASGAIRGLKGGGVALVAIGHSPGAWSVSAQTLEGLLANLVARILGRIRVSRILLEGGATASAVLRVLGVTRLVAGRSIGPGLSVFRTPRAEAPEIVIKPGSYPWPESAWPVHGEIRTARK